MTMAGNAVIDLTLGSQFIGCRAVTSASPLSAALLGFSSQRAAWTICSGKVEAIRICDTS